MSENNRQQAPRHQSEEQPVNPSRAEDAGESSSSSTEEQTTIRRRRQQDAASAGIGREDRPQSTDDIVAATRQHEQQQQPPPPITDRSQRSNSYEQAARTIGTDTVAAIAEQEKSLPTFKDQVMDRSQRNRQTQASPPEWQYQDARQGPVTDPRPVLSAVAVAVNDPTPTNPNDESLSQAPLVFATEASSWTSMDLEQIRCLHERIHELAQQITGTQQDNNNAADARPGSDPSSHTSTTHQHQRTLPGANQKHAKSWTTCLPSSNLLDYRMEATVGSEPIDMRSKLFGRDALLSEISEHLNYKKDDRPLLVLAGESGIGKSHLALKAAWDWIGQQDDSSTTTRRFGFWLNGSDEDSMKNSYVDAIRSIRQENGDSDDIRKDLTVSRLAEVMHDSLSELVSSSSGIHTFEWILVYDNVPKPVMFDKWFLPKGWNLETRRCAHTILVTVHEKYFATGYVGESLGYVKRFCIPELGDTDAVDLMLEGVNDDNPSHQVMQLAKKLVNLFNNLPLAIVAANGELRSRLQSDDDAALMSIETFLTTYMELLEATEFETVTKRVRASVARTIEYAITHTEECKKILGIAAHVRPDRMELHLLGGNNEATKKGLSELIRLKLLRTGKQSCNPGYYMHRLYQLVARMEFPSSLHAVKALHQLVTRFDRNQPGSAAHWSQPISAARHVIALWENMAEKKLDLTDMNFLVMWASVLERTGFILRWTSQDFDAAERMLESCLDLYKTVDYVGSARNVDDDSKREWAISHARAYSISGRIKKALSKYEQAKQSFDSGLGIVSTLSNGCSKAQELRAELLDDVGRVHQNCDQYDQARRHFEDALALRKSLIVFSSDQNVDTALKNEGRAFLLRARKNDLMIEKSPSGIGTAATAESFGGLADTELNIGRLHQKIGEYALAQERFEIALGAIHEQWGDCANMAVVTALHHAGLNVLLQVDAEHDESKLKLARDALETFQASRQMAQAVFGPDARNPTIATAVNDIARAVAKVGDVNMKQAEVMEGTAKSTKYRTALESYKDAFAAHIEALDMLKQVFLAENDPAPHHKKIRESYGFVANLCQRLQELSKKMDQPQKARDLGELAQTLAQKFRI